jgi:cell division septum initiation protein DivIVA
MTSFFDDETGVDRVPSPAPTPPADTELEESEPGLPESLYQQPESEQLLRRIADAIATARPMPLSASVMINKEEVLDLLTEAVERLPEELRAARWLLKEREEYLAKVRAEGDEIVEAARARVERMVQRTEVVKASESRARHIVQSAQDEARRLRHECEDFCDQRLASFEIVLERTRRMVQAGREKLQGPPLVAPESEEPPETEQGQSFFDQDQQ